MKPLLKDSYVIPNLGILAPKIKVWCALGARRRLNISYIIMLFEKLQNIKKIYS